MRAVLIAATGFLIGAGLLAGLLVALPPTTKVTVRQASPQMTAMPHMAQGRTGMMASASVPAMRKLTIRHVLKGCHVWSDGKMSGPTLRVHLQRGQKLSILDQDVDAHQMMEFSGPAHMRMSGPMTMNHSMTLAFMKKGVYRLGTKTVEMPGGMEVKTVGPDNQLRLVVTVA